LMALLGLHRNNGAPASEDLQALLPHAGNFNQHPRSALGLEALVSGLLDGLPVSVEPCVPRVVPIPRPARALLGTQACTLGDDALLGSRIAERAGQACIHIGPIPAAILDDTLPGGTTHARLMHAISHYVEGPTACVLGLRVAPTQR